jgi:hypothetical protein
MPERGSAGLWRGATGAGVEVSAEIDQLAERTRVEVVLPAGFS